MSLFCPSEKSIVYCLILATFCCKYVQVVVTENQVEYHKTEKLVSNWLVSWQTSMELSFCHANRLKNLFNSHLINVNICTSNCRITFLWVYNILLCTKKTVWMSLYVLCFRLYVCTFLYWTRFCCLKTEEFRAIWNWNDTKLWIVMLL